MSNMLSSTSMVNLSLNNFKNNDLLYLSHTFSGCSYLKSLDLSNLNTSKIKIMDYTFSECRSLISLDLSSFNTERVSSFSHIFQRCSQLETIIFFENFKTNNAESMNSMFENDDYLLYIDLSTFRTDLVSNMENLFSGCYQLFII